MRRDGLEDISSTAHLLEDYQGNLVEGQVISEEHLIESGRPPKRGRLKQIERLTEIWAATFTFPIFILRLFAMGLLFGTLGGYAYFVGHKYKNDTWAACRHDAMWMVVLSVLFAAVLIADILMGLWQCSMGIGRVCCQSHAYFLVLWTLLVLFWSIYSAIIFSSTQSYTCNQELVLFGFSVTISFLVVGFSCIMMCLIQQCFLSKLKPPKKQQPKIVGP